MRRSLLFRQRQMLLLRRLLHQNRKQLLLLLPRNPKFLRQIFLHLQNQKSLLLLPKENGKASLVVSSLRERNPKGRARAAGKARAVAGRVSPAASSQRESVPRVRAAGKVSPAVAGKASQVDSSLKVNGPKGMVKVVGKVSLADSNPAENGRDSLAALSRGPKARVAASDRVQRVREVVSDQGAKAPKCHRR